jgi:hypothetical protein
MVDGDYGGGAAEGLDAAEALRQQKYYGLREKLQQLTERLGPELRGTDLAGALVVTGADTMIKLVGRERCVKYLRDLATHVESPEYRPS